MSYVPTEYGPGTNTGHGHAWERPDGRKARCGGTRFCLACKADKEKYGTKTDKQED